MIRLQDKARLECDHIAEGGRCDQSIRVSLVLMPAGGFRPDFSSRSGALGWQCTVDKNNPQFPYQGRCPVHAIKESRVQLVEAQ